MRMTEVERRHRIAKSIFQGTSRVYDLAVLAYTWGLDRRWKRRMMDVLPRVGVWRCLDLACGTGIVTFELAKRYPDALVIGADLMEEYVEQARAKARKRVSNVEFIQVSAEEVEDELTPGFDVITASYLPKYMNREALARVCDRLGGPSCTVVLHDFSIPRGPVMRILLRLHWMVVRWIMRILGWRGAAREFMQTVESPWVQEVKIALERRGFTVEVDELSRGLATLIVARRGAA